LGNAVALTTSITHKPAPSTASPQASNVRGAARRVALPPFLQRRFAGRATQEEAALDDHYERRADQVDEDVMRMPEPLLQRQAAPEEEEEKPLQTRSSNRGPLLVQRQMVEADEDEEEELQLKAGPAVHRQSLEDKQDGLQGKFATSQSPVPFQGDRSHAESGGGLPSALKAGLEALSGMDLSSVRVHYNSSKPALLGALAYTQGQDIHVAPAQDRHLPHEGWHAVQQMRGRVTPTMQFNGTSINDDASLEREADIMGAKALQMKSAVRDRTALSAPRKAPVLRPGAAVQRAMKFEIQTVNHVWMVDRVGTVKPVPRKYGIKGASEKGEEQFLTTGVSGDPHLRRGDFVEANEGDPSKPAQYVWTYTVIDQKTGKVSRPKKRRNRGRVNRGTYELKYVDTAGNPLDLHRDAFGRFQPGAGPRFMRRVRKTKEGSAIELQAESGGFIEFETPKWHRKWSAINARIEEAQNMTRDMESAATVTDEDTKNVIRAKVDRLKDAGDRTASVGTLHEWPTNFMVGHLPVIRRGGRLLVEIVPGHQGVNWFARIQASESLALQEFESLLKEHESATNVVDTLGPAQTIFDSLKPAGPHRSCAVPVRSGSRQPS